MEKADFKVTKEGTTLEVLLGRELSTSNAPAQMDELAKYMVIKEADAITYDYSDNENVLTVSLQTNKQ